jgi:hypothetical protein
VVTSEPLEWLEILDQEGGTLYVPLFDSSYGAWQLDPQMVEIENVDILELPPSP